MRHTFRTEWKTRKRDLQILAAVWILLTFPLTWPGQEAGAQAGGEDHSAAAAQTGREDGPAGTGKETGEAPMVALTFDDGPDATYTPILLDGLKERGVKASFFVIGANIEKDGGADLIRRMHEEGHLIGNHTYRHVDLSGLSVSKAEEEIRKTDRLIREITGEETVFVRPPFGAFPEGEEEEDKLYVKWTVDSRDWVTKNAEEIVRKVVTDTGENDIILMHDCYGTSVEAALEIVDILESEGYEFVLLDELLIE